MVLFESFGVLLEPSQPTIFVSGVSPTGSLTGPRLNCSMDVRPASASFCAMSHMTESTDPKPLSLEPAAPVSKDLPVPRLFDWPLS